MKVALRYKALYLDINKDDIDMTSEATVPVMALVSRLNKTGYCVSEELLHALCQISADELVDIVECIDDVYGVKLNWAPLVKAWDKPTGECRADHIVTLVANLFGEEAGFKGTTLQCGHLIPSGTFPLNKYNGCPFCGTPFETSNEIYTGQASKMKELRLFTDEELRRVMVTLLSSVTPLDANQKESLNNLIDAYEMPDVEIKMKETAMIVIKRLVEQDNYEAAGKMMKTPTDIMRYLWYEKTGHVQIIEPKTLVAHSRRLMGGIPGLKPDFVWSTSKKVTEEMRIVRQKQALKLKYDRKTCLRVAQWLNDIPMTAKQAAENMHPKRGMWVRFIRALRLAEYSHRHGMEHLKELLDVFYREDYATWQGDVDGARRRNDKTQVLRMLKQRPGMFARCLFATMLRFGAIEVIVAFDEIADKLPARLLLSLGNAAEMYFDKKGMRIARPITGVTHNIQPNKLLALYSEEDLTAMVEIVNDVYAESMRRRFAKLSTESKTIYVDPKLYNIPVSVGDRATTIQDASCALMGTRFPIEGDTVRLFMQWGKGLKAQHLDMDLSARISLAGGGVKECAYFNLVCEGAKHSGDIRSIPDMVGTAEYIELTLSELERVGSKYVTFTCNAYSCGALSPNLVVGWMNTEHPMTISEKNGVAYDPSCVQHMVRISESNLSKGLVFGVLDVKKREIIWLEMPFTAMTIRGANEEAVDTLLKKLEAKLSVGQLLEMKAKAQNLEMVDDAERADEAYTYEWALNSAEVSTLLAI